MKGKYGMRASMLLALVLCCQPVDFPAYAEEAKEQAEDHGEKIGLSMGRDLSRILMTKLGLQQAAKEEKKNPALDTKSKKNLKIDPKFLRFDTAAYTYRKEHDLYYTARKLPLKGLLQRTDGVKKLRLEVRDFSGTVISQKEIPAAQQWKIEEPILSYGLNEVIATAKLADGSEIAAQLRLYNADDKNIAEHLGFDYDYLGRLLEMDTDEDGIPDWWEIEDFESDPLNPMSMQPGVRDGELDWDEDGLTNEFELKHDLSPFLSSTDMDDLDDRAELERYKTDPREHDTDRDGAGDSWEVQNGYDPLRFNGAFHLKKKVESVGKIQQVEVDLQGVSGEGVHSFEMTPVEDMFLNPEMGGYIGTAYNLDIRGEFKSAALTFTLDPKLFEQKGFDPAIYRFNDETQAVEEVENQVRKGNKLSADLTRFAKYIVLEKDKADPALWEFTLEEEMLESVDIEKDTDGDGIPDFFEKAMQSGKLRTNTGVPLTGMFYDNSDSDGDGLEDGEEIQITLIDVPSSVGESNAKPKIFGKAYDQTGPAKSESTEKGMNTEAHDWIFAISSGRTGTSDASECREGGMFRYPFCKIFELLQSRLQEAKIPE